MVVLSLSSGGLEFKSFRINLCSRGQDLKSAQLKRSFEVQASELEKAKGSSLLLNETNLKSLGSNPATRKAMSSSVLFRKAVRTLGYLGGRFSGNGGVRSIRELSGRVIAPDDDVLDVNDVDAALLSDLSHGAIVVEPGHGREVLLGDGGGVVRADGGIGVGRVSNHQDFD